MSEYATTDDVTKAFSVFSALVEQRFEQKESELSRLKSENEKLKEALSGRTVSCSNCNKITKENEKLRRALEKIYNGLPEKESYILTAKEALAALGKYEGK